MARLIIQGPANIDLRQYTARILNFKATRWDQEEVAICPWRSRLRATRTARRPDGPNCELIFGVARQRAAASAPENSKPAQLVALTPAVKPPVVQKTATPNSEGQPEGETEELGGVSSSRSSGPGLFCRLP